ncbi:exodeoxyribonuclease V subunit gamma [Rhodococcus triatomae]|uniref:RecBCD enzyme subunit RecC n=1 Tax=Rhodococcus triatomae TaxID=300028 RepID=A0A1G8BBR2_9NOCA|nr:exodeoxyribonuclease V subunit gamma [Rhodococcus triatomae]QNG17451.1 exodeoxyribonuclease V subunit gamma [Rhodococcus triatomae]QNG22881.1 exodeoxyribonuclease V subunit gamma [Rhodococcus triatomae]SDH30657.1 DNA helicase/exodeoxyribonuclease V, gamma subunit [Rhodococcus triatomae]
MLRVHRAERTDTLAAELGRLLSAPLDDPFAAEVIAVPAKGVERWLTQRLSAELGADAGSDGVAANIAFPSPARLVDEAAAAVARVAPEDDPWSPERLVWTVLEVIDDSMAEEWAAPLARHLGGGDDEYRSRRRYATALHVVSLLRAYASQRPAMLAAWVSDTGQVSDTGWAPDGVGDGAGNALAADQLWQAELFRRVRRKVDAPSPAERLPDICAQLRDRPDLSELPSRFSLFGPTRLATDQLAVLDALAAHRDVHLWLPHPSPRMWDELVTAAPPVRRAEDDGALEVRNPLLAALSRDVREMQYRIGRLSAEHVHHQGAPAAASLLGALQDDVVHDRPPSPAAADGSVTVHACHGPARQVEVLREALLHAFADDPTLEPRDVIVMCPDVETYAPLVRAVFGAAGEPEHEHPGHRLRVRLADRGLRRTNPVLDVVATLLVLAEGRVNASALLDLADSTPVRTRFDFTDDDLERLREWTAESGARWGIGPRQRAGFGLAEFPQNTFGTALDRILLGACSDEDGWLGLALPLGDVDSSDIDLAGRFSEFVDRLDVVLRDLAGPHSVEHWGRVLGRALDLVTATSPRDDWQQGQARRELAEATEFGGDRRLQLADVRAMLAARLAGRPTRANFRTGELTVCTMVPMRSVPHRVVALLGLDDDVFPRSAGIDGDDVCAGEPLIGERDHRSEDRQLLLDAIMSAGQRLLLFYTGADPVTGGRRPPAIPLGGLMDVLAGMTGGAVEETGVLTRHPLQPFDPSNFVPERPFGFDRAALAGARAAARPAQPAPSAAGVTLAPVPESDVDLTDLVAFLVNPAQAFLRQRLGVRVPELDEALSDSLAVELDPLQRWDIGERMLASRLAGEDPARFRAAEWRRGTLPPFALGNLALADIERAVDALADACLPLYGPDPDTAYVSVDLGAGRRLSGTVSGIRDGVLVRSSFSRLAPKHRMAAWVQLLAVAVHSEGAVRTAVTTGRGSGHRPAWRSTLTAPEDAASVLRRLVALRDRGLCAPLPVSPTASEAYAERRVRGDDPAEALAAADRCWSGKFGDREDRVMVYLHGRVAELDALAAAAGTVEPSGFGDVALELWSPLLAAEQVGQP